MLQIIYVYFGVLTVTKEIQAKLLECRNIVWVIHNHFAYNSYAQADLKNKCIPFYNYILSLYSKPKVHRIFKTWFRMISLPSF